MFKPLRNLMIVVPTKDNVSAPLITKLIKWSSLGAEVVIVHSSPLIDLTRNIGVKQFLSSKKSHMLFIDSDTIPEVDAPQRLLKHKKDIIGGIYNLVMTDKGGKTAFRPSAFTLMIPGRPLTEAVTVTPNTGLTKAVILATGLLMISRKALSKIKEPWFEFVWLDDKHSAFHGEDVSFCMKAEKEGIEMWCDTDVQALHYKQIFI